MREESLVDGILQAINLPPDATTELLLNVRADGDNVLGAGNAVSLHMRNPLLPEPIDQAGPQGGLSISNAMNSEQPRPSTASGHLRIHSGNVGMDDIGRDATSGPQQAGES